MTTALSATVALSVAARQDNALSVGAADGVFRLDARHSFLSADDRVFTSMRQLAASASETLDLNGTALIDAFGQALTLVSLKGLIVVADSTNPHDITVGGAESLAAAAMFGAASGSIKVKPGGMLALAAPSPSGYAVMPDATDLLKVTNSGAAAVRYTLVLIGEAGPSFDPKSLYLDGEPGVVLDPGDFSTLFQDSGMTVPVTGPGQPVVKALDKSGNGHTATFTNCTIEVDANGCYYFAANGSNASGSTVSIDFTGTDKLCVIVGTRTTTTSGSQALVELSTNSTTATGAFLSYLASGNRVSFLRHSANVTLTATGKAPTHLPVVYTDEFDIGGAAATDELKMRMDGEALSPSVTAAGPAGAGNFGNYPIHLMARNGSSLRLTGGLYPVIIRGGALSQDRRTKAENWLKGRSGLLTPGTRGIALGDSTVAAYMGARDLLDFVDTSLTRTTLAVPGHTIDQQRVVVVASLLRETAAWLYIQVALNDLNPAEAASVAIARLQNLVNIARVYLRPITPIVIGQMTPCRSRLITLYGGTNGPIAYQKWLDINEAIAGNGANPITGVDGRVIEHVALLNDGSGNLRPEHDSGDGIHTNDPARAINGWAAARKLRSIGAQ